MRISILWATLFVALSIQSMHTHIDDESEVPPMPKYIEMKDFASKPPSANANSSSKTAIANQNEKEYKSPICFGNMNRKQTGLYSHMYTLTSVDKKSEGKP